MVRVFMPRCILSGDDFLIFESLLMKSTDLNIFFHCLRRLNRKYFAFMVDYLHLLKPLITSVTLIVFKRFHMRGLCVTFYGLILMTDVVGVFLLGVQDIPLAKYNARPFLSLWLQCPVFALSSFR